MKSQPLTVVSACSEIYPYSKTGGLADVTGALPRALRALHHHVVSVTPLYESVDRKKHNLSLWKKDVKISIDSENSTHINIWQGELEKNLPVYLVENGLFRSKNLYGNNSNQKFYLLALAVFKIIELLGVKPSILHCHEWQTGLIPYFLKTRFRDFENTKKTLTLFTIHNLSFQMERDWWTIPEEMRDDGVKNLPNFKDKNALACINFAKRAIMYCTIMNTVSEQYAEEIVTKEFGGDLSRTLRHNQKKLFGIVNGIDYNVFNPETDPGLYKNFSYKSLYRKLRNKAYLQKKFKLPVRPLTPIIGMVTRISEQKGFDLLKEIIDAIMRVDVQFVIYGGGDKCYEKYLARWKRKFPKKVAANLAFDTKDATQIYAGSDMFLMPSRFEPCGLGQMISLRYGSIPIVRSTGGLADTIQNYNPRTRKGNGFSFKTYDPYNLLIAITRAITHFQYKDNWQELVRKGMRQSFSWEIPAKKYVLLYKKAISMRQIS